MAWLGNQLTVFWPQFPFLQALASSVFIMTISCRIPGWGLPTWVLWSRACAGLPVLHSEPTSAEWVSSDAMNLCRPESLNAVARVAVPLNRGTQFGVEGAWLSARRWYAFAHWGALRTSWAVPLFYPAMEAYSRYLSYTHLEALLCMSVRLLGWGTVLARLESMSLTSLFLLLHVWEEARPLQGLGSLVIRNNIFCCVFPDCMFREGLNYCLVLIFCILNSFCIPL